jgi:hypothetical protein
MASEPSFCWTFFRREVQGTPFRLVETTGLPPFLGQRPTLWLSGVCFWRVPRAFRVALAVAPLDRLDYTAASVDTPGRSGMRASKTARIAASVAVMSIAFAVAGNAYARAAHCAVPRRWRVVAQNSIAVVITGTAPTTEEDGTRFPEHQWRYCLRTVGGFSVAVTNLGAEDPRMDLFQVETFVLSGHYVGYTTVSWPGGGRYGGPFAEVAIIDLLTGKRAGREVGGSGDGGEPDVLPVKSLLLSASGAAVWQAATLDNYAPGPTTWVLQALDARNGATLDLDSWTSPTNDVSVPSPFANLQLQQCEAGCSPLGATFAWWTNNGVWHSARIA